MSNDTAKMVARTNAINVHEDYSLLPAGLAPYGPDFADQYRHAAGYVDRILKGEKPGDMPVQVPTKYELVINSKLRRLSA